MSLITSSGSPGPATNTLTSGANREMTGSASIKTFKPFRGSSKRPINPMVLPCHLPCGVPCIYREAYIPLGMMTASVSK